MTRAKPAAQVAEPRVPRQVRGRARREAIIDSAAAIVVKDGITNLSMHAVARHAGASIGSIYHFFRDKDELTRALATRHTNALTDIFQVALQRSDKEWADAKTPDVIDYLFGWAISYFSRFPDALATLDLQDSTRPRAFLELIQRVMQIRLGKKKGLPAAVTLYAVATGALLLAKDPNFADGDRIVAEIPAVLRAYLSSLEKVR